MIREVELKYRFPDQHSFEALLKFLGGEQKIEHQTNSLFDTSDLKLKAQHIFLRIRKSNEKFKFTCKAAPEGIGKPSDMLSIHDEWEQVIDSPKQDPIELLSQTWPHESESSKQTRLSLLKRVLAIIGNEKPILVGSFKNTRMHVPCSIGSHKLDLEFDATDFGGGQIDYELELELPESLAPELAQAELDKLFKRLDIQTRPSSGKAERLFGLKINQ